MWRDGTIIWKHKTSCSQGCMRGCVWWIIIGLILMWLMITRSFTHPFWPMRWWWGHHYHYHHHSNHLPTTPSAHTFRRVSLLLISIPTRNCTFLGPTPFFLDSILFKKNKNLINVSNILDNLKILNFLKRIIWYFD